MTEQLQPERPETEPKEANPTTTEAAAKPKKRRWWLRVLVALLLILLLPLLFLATGFGQRTAIGWLDSWLEPLSIEQVEGSLQSGLSLKNLAYKMDGVDVQAGQADLHLGVSCLLEWRACVENVALKDTTVAIDTSKLTPSQPDENTTPLGKINLPIGVALNQLQLDNIQVKVDEMDIALTHFHSGITGEGNLLTLSPTLLDGLTLSLAPSKVEDEPSAKKSEISTASSSSSAKKTDWAALKKQLAEPLLTKANPIVLPLNFAIPELEAKNIKVEQKVKDNKPTAIVNVSQVSLKGQTDDQAIALETLKITSDRGNINGNGKLTLSDNYPLDWQLNADMPTLTEFNIPASTAKLALNGELFGKANLDLQTKGAMAASLKGSVQLAEPKTPFNLQLNSAAAQYPFMPKKDEQVLKLNDLALSLNGDLLNYALDGKLKSEGMGMPPADLTVKGKGELTAFEIADLQLNALDGKANLTGKVDWVDGVAWQSKLNLAGVNTKSLLPDWAAVLTGGLDSTGFAARGEKAEQWAVEVKNLDLHGNLLQKNLQLKGNFTADTKTLLNVPEARLIYGSNNIAMKGVLGEKSDFSANINAPDLSGLLPNLGASIKGDIQLKGKVTEPNLNLDLTAQNVHYQQYKLAQLTAKGTLNSEKTIQGDLAVALRQLDLGNGVKVAQANLEAKGSEANHQLNLTANGEPIGANLKLSGSFDRKTQVWNGILANMAIENAEFGRLQTEQAVKIGYNHKQIAANISAHCWTNPNAKLCFPTAFTAGQEGKVPFEIRQFNLQALKKYLDAKTELSGLVSAKGDASWFKNRQPQVNVEINSPSIIFVQKLDGGKSFPLGLMPVKIKANLADNNLKLVSDVQIENNGRLTTDLLLKDVAKNRALSGNIKLSNLSLKLAQALLNQGDSLGGEINANLTVGGTTLAPLLHGNLNLTGLKARSTMMPFDITGGQLAMRFNGTSSTLRGEVQTNQSQLNLEGDADWRNLNAWHTRVKAQANRFRVEIPNMAKVEVSPDVEVKATPKELHIGGVIEIPWARIEVEELPDSAVSVSDDEVIMDGSAKTKIPLASRQIPAQTASGMAIRSDLKIQIGDDVKLDAYGLKTDLNGLLSVRQGKQGLGLYGQVNLKNGSFASFGQDLIIRKGVISFAGLPSQPSLNIEAIRNPEAIEDTNVTAGLRVTGSADSPDVKVFSEPSMSQDQALSYILTGRGLENSGDAGSSNSIAAALLSMSLSKSSKTIGSVGSTFGLNDLSVTTGGIGDNTKVIVSASLLSPRFKVKYGVGIFAPLTELTLRYRLAPNLYLQGVSSLNQALDLLYRFEFD